MHGWSCSNEFKLCKCIEFGSKQQKSHCNHICINLITTPNFFMVQTKIALSQLTKPISHVAIGKGSDNARQGQGDGMK